MFNNNNNNNNYNNLNFIDNYELKLVSYNCLNFKSNRDVISDIIYKNDASFFIEHWLNTEEKYLFEEICKGEYNIIFHSDYDITNGIPKGRPHGGLCWVIHRRFNLVSQTIFNKNLIKVSIQREDITFNLYGTWLPYDNNSPESLCYSKQVSL